MSGRYILKGDRPVACEDLMEWARWFETADRSIARTRTEHGDVSTIFLGLDHGFSFNGPPMLYETMIFGGAHDQYQRRYTTKEAALAGHAEAVALADTDLLDQTEEG